jgi:CheY-like chemotaxis protein
MNIPWVIELRAPHLLQPVKVFVEDRVIVGRSVPGQRQQPDIDLGASEADDHPVAARHIALCTKGDLLMAIDLNSSSGTFLNGMRMTPNIPYPLQHGDQLRLGRLKLDVDVVISPSTSGGMHYQPGLNLYDQTQPGDNQWILIVEDDSEIADLLSRLMENAGYTARTCGDVVNAMRIFSQQQPNGIILDMNLPDMDSLEFCRYVRRDVLHPTIPILAINTRLGMNNATEAMQAGADVVMEKPLRADDVRDVVIALVNQHEKGADGVSTRRLAHVTPFEVFPPGTRHQGAVLFVANFDRDPILLTGEKSISLGRQPGTGALGSHTHLDLSKYDAANCGVSRVHAYLHYQDRQYYVEDVGSRNGTFLNGQQVEPYEYTLLHNADEIRLGMLRMYVYFFEDGAPTT